MVAERNLPIKPCIRFLPLAVVLIAALFLLFAPVPPSTPAGNIALFSGNSHENTVVFPENAHATGSSLTTAEISALISSPGGEPLRLGSARGGTAGLTLSYLDTERPHGLSLSSVSLNITALSSPPCTVSVSASSGGALLPACSPLVLGAETSTVSCSLDMELLGDTNSIFLSLRFIPDGNEAEILVESVSLTFRYSSAPGVNRAEPAPDVNLNGVSPGRELSSLPERMPSREFSGKVTPSFSMRTRSGTEETELVVRDRETGNEISRERGRGAGDIDAGIYDAEISPGGIFKGAHFRDLVLDTNEISVSMDTVSDANALPSVEGKVVAKQFYIDPYDLNFSAMTITLTASGRELYKCADWNSETETCRGTWEKIADLAIGEDYNIVIAPGDPGFIEAGLDILTVQSYPTVGGHWTVDFNTVGAADLVIQGWEDTNFGVDLEFSSLTCGSTELSPVVGGNTITYNDYNCEETGHESSLVLTAGRHVLRFDFGGETEYAYNSANNAPDINITHIDGNRDDLALPEFSYSADRNLTIDFNVIDLDNNRLDANIWYSEIAGGKENFLAEDLNLSEIDSGMVAYWHFNMGNPMQDATTNNNDGTNQGADYVSGGRFKGAMDFVVGNTDWIDLPNIDLGSVFTISVWMRSSNSNGTIKTIFSTGHNAASWEQVGITFDYAGTFDDIIRFFAQDTGGSATLYSTTQVTDGKWHLVTAVRNGNNFYLYIDGSLEASDTDAGMGTDYDNFLDPDIGCWVSESTGFMDGTIDEVAIWDRALTPEEIHKAYYGTYNHCADSNFVETTQCSFDFNISSALVSDANYFIDIDISDGSDVNSNTSDNNFLIDNVADNTAPDINITHIDSYVDNNAGYNLPQYFSYFNDGNLTITFTVHDQDRDDLNFSMWYSSSAGAKENKIISDLNLGTAQCDSSDWTNTVQCSYDWNANPWQIADGNYFIDIDLNDGYSTDSNTTSSFRVSPCPRDTLTSASSTTFYGADCNVIDTGTDGIIYITANNITLDCNGLDLNGNGTGYGISIDDARNLTLKNCSTREYAYGIRGSTMGSSTVIEDCNQHDNTSYGIYSLGGQDVNVINNNNFNNSTGIRAQNTNYLSVWNSTIHDSATGIFLSGSADYADIHDNNIRGTSYGIKLGSTLTGGHEIYKNHLNGGGYALYIDQSCANGAHIHDNNLLFQDTYGTYIRETGPFVFEDNNIYISPGKRGLHFDNAQGASAINNDINGGLYGIFVKNSTDLNIALNETRAEPNGIGLYFYEDGAKRSNVEDNNFHGSAWGMGIYTQGEIADINIHGNTFSNNINYGLYLNQVKETRIYDNFFIGNDRGLYTNQSSDNNIHDNNAEDNTSRGIAIENSSNRNRVYRNKTNNNTSYNILISASENNEIYDNNAQGGTYSIQVSAAGSADNNIARNIVTGAGNSGIYLDFADSGNTIEDNNSHGNVYNIRIKDSGNQIATGNLLNTGTAGFLIADSDDVNLTGNQIIAASSYGIFVDDADRLWIRDNNFSDQAGISAVYCSSGDDINISRNVFKNSGEDGLYNLGCNWITFSDNNVTNVSYGINHAGGSNLIVRSNEFGVNVADVLPNGGDNFYVFENTSYGTAEAIYINVGSKTGQIYDNNFWSTGNRVFYTAPSSECDINIWGNNSDGSTYGIYHNARCPIYGNQNRYHDNNIVNSGVGLVSDTSGGGAIFYNNYIYGNALNAQDLNGTNDWNTAKDCGLTNILGGGCVGGNYYDDYTGYDTDGDGIGYAAYSFNGGIDYLPLTNDLNYSPDINITYIESYVDNNAGYSLPEYFSYFNDGNLTITFTVHDYEQNDLNFNMWYSSSAGAKENKIISDLNLGTAQCDSSDWTNTVQCSYDWNANPWQIADGNYFIDIDLNDGYSTDSNTTSSFRVSPCPRDTLTSASSTTFYGANCNVIDAGVDGIITITANNITLDCNGLDLNGNKTGYGIYNENYNNIILQNCNVRNYDYGLYLRNSDSSLVQDNNVSGISTYGIYLWGGSDNNVQDNNATGNYTGIYIRSESNNNTVRNSTNNNSNAGIILNMSNSTLVYNNNASGNPYGIYLWGGSDNNVVRNSTNNNSNYGITLTRGVDFTVVEDNNMSGNNYGFHFSDLAHDNNAYDNNVWNNTTGIYIAADSNQNLFYNNWVSDNGTNVSDLNGFNDYNTTKTLATNIIGGLYKGGNYWGDYLGMDSDGDGLGNVVYSFTTGIDFLPLAPVNTFDMNLTHIDGNADNNGLALPPYSYIQDGNLTIKFNVYDTNRNDLNFNMWYSSSAGAKENKVVSDLNLGTSRCDSTDWTTTVQCNYDLNIDSALMGDGNWFIDIDLNNRVVTDSNSSSTFMVDNTAPSTHSTDINWASQNVDANVHFTCSDTNSGCAAMQFRLDTDLTGAVSYGAWQAFSGTTDQNVYVTGDGNWAIDVNSTDNVGNMEDTNTLYIIILTNRDPDINLTHIDGYIDNNGSKNLPAGFSYSLDGNLTVTFGVMDPDRDDLNFNMWYSTSAGAKENKIVSDLNLTSAYCDSQDWASVVQCSYDFNIDSSLVSDNSYYLDIDLNDGTVVDSNSSSRFVVANTGVVTTADANSTWQSTDANVTLTCTGGCASTAYRVDTDLTGAVSYGAWQTYTAAGIVLTEDGNFALDYNSTNNGGVIETTRTTYVLIDQGMPSISISDPTEGDVIGSTYTMQYAVADSMSGVESTYAKSGTGSWRANSTATTYTFAFTDNGNEVLRARACDYAGNCDETYVNVFVYTALGEGGSASAGSVSTGGGPPSTGGGPGRSPLPDTRELSMPCEAGIQCRSGKCIEGFCGECVADTTCAGDEYCSDNHLCLKVPCECGFVSGHVCTPYECCSNSDCHETYICRDNICEKEISPYLLLTAEPAAPMENTPFKVIVRDNKGKAISGATITAGGRAYTADKIGRATLSLPSGSHRLVASYEGYLDDSRIVRVLEAAQILVQDRANVNEPVPVKVLDSDGNPLANVEVVVIGGGTSYLAKTNEKGIAYIIPTESGDFFLASKSVALATATAAFYTNPLEGDEFGSFYFQKVVFEVGAILVFMMALVFFAFVKPFLRKMTGK